MSDRTLPQIFRVNRMRGIVRSSQSFKLLWLIAEFVHAGFVLWLRFPRLERDGKLSELQRWATRVLAILEVEVRCDGSPPPCGVLVVANHLSWLDILVMLSLMPGVFVAKAEVRFWPLIGSMAHASATIFVERSSRRSTHTMIDATLKAFEQGYSVIAFPEGTSSDGSELAVFHANIFEAAIRAQARVQTVTLGYVHAQSGSPSKEALFVGDMTLASSVRRVMASSSIQSRVHIGECIPPQGHSRKSLASHAHQRIRGQLLRQRQGLE